VKIRNGHSCLLWSDCWCDEILLNKLSELYSFAKNKAILVNKASTQLQLSHFFQLATVRNSFCPNAVLQLIFEGTNFTDTNDAWSTIGSSDILSSANIYKKIIGSHQVHDAFKWTWKSFSQPRHKVFSWLLIKDRLHTKKYSKKKHGS